MRRGFFIFFLLQSLLGFCQDGLIDLEPIIVEKETLACTSLSESQIEVLPLSSSEDSVNYFSGLDLRKRSDFGIQQDLSIRGSIFEDNKVFINGTQVSDPQTGHFSLEIPFTIADLQEVGLDKNGQAVSFTLKKPKEEGILVTSSFGEHALFNNLFSVNFPLGNIKNRISLEQKKSKGDIADTDFDIYNISFHSLYEEPNTQIEFLYGFLKKDFGANGFYAAPQFMQEEEHTLQNFSSLRCLIKDDYYDVEVTPFFRRHDDEFILVRHNPSFFNTRHTTYIYGSDSKVDFKSLGAFLITGFRQETITSSNLGKHKRDSIPLFLGLHPLKLGDVMIELRAGASYWRGWEWLDSSSFEAALPLGEVFSFRFSFDRTYRLPSFTELFYSSPSNQGNSNLQAQRMNNFQWSCLWQDNNLEASLSFFLRRQDNAIDWVRNSLSLPWQAQNVGDFTAKGLEIDVNLILGNQYLRRIDLGYGFLDLDKKSSFAYSKYVFDFLTHRVVFGPEFHFGNSLFIKPVFIFEKPIRRDSRNIIDLHITYAINKSLSLFLEGKNLLNKSYQEIEGLEADGRWLRGGVLVEF